MIPLRHSVILLRSFGRVDRSQSRATSSSPSSKEARRLVLPTLDPALEYRGQGKVLIGNWAKISKSFSESEVRAFSELSLDKNPVHLYQDYAESTPFKSRIVHGYLVASLISAVAGTKLPGDGSIYVAQSLAFRRPVYFGDQITATILVTAIQSDRRRVLFDTFCSNQNGDIVISGEAVCLAKEDRF